MDIEDETPIFRLEEFEAHIKDLRKIPETPTDTELFDAIELQLTEYNISPLIPRLLPSIVQILMSTQQDPTVIASMSVKLLQPINFEEALDLASDNALILALESPAPAANILAISVIEKAAKNTHYTYRLSNMKEVVETFIRVWLSNPDTGVGEKATQVLGKLLEVDNDGRPSVEDELGRITINDQRPPGHCPLWRRIFQDGDIYKLLYSVPYLENHDGLSQKQKTIAQGRLLRILPKLGKLDCQALCFSYKPNIDRAYSENDPDAMGGILWFAAMKMVDKSDMLMHITLTMFFIDFLQEVCTANLANFARGYIHRLMRDAMAKDIELRQSVEAAAANPESSPELKAFIALFDRKGRWGPNRYEIL